jgi:hypothetical protein
MKVYEYGALAPTENLDLVRAQMRLAHQYGNKLVEIERARRERATAAQVSHADVAPLAVLVKQLEADLEAARERISGSRQTHRENKVAAANVTAARDMKAQLKDARLKLREAKALARGDTAVADALNDAAEWAKDQVRRARADFSAQGLWWGAYLIQEQAADAARKSVTPPRFKSWDGSGHLAVQLQNGLDVADVLECTDTRLRLRSPPPEVFKTAGQRKAKRTEVRLRIQSDGREPVWTTVPIVMHRPLPPGARVKWAHLLVHRLADKEKWKVQLVVDEAACATRPDPNLAKVRGACGVDLGWRLLPDRALRVAALVGEAHPGDVKYDETLVLPANLVSVLEHTDSLRSIRDKMFDELRPRLAEWLRGAAATSLPEESWAKAQVAYAHLWKRPGNAVRLHREHGDIMPPDLRTDVEAFLKADTHLWRWEANERQAFLDRRREIYRLWSVDVARWHTQVTVEKFDLRVFAKRGAPEEGTTTDPRRYTRLRAIAAPSILRECLKQACVARGVDYIEAPAKDTTRRCRFCGHVDVDINAAKDITVRCPECGKEDDQDLRAAENLLRLGAAAGTEGAAADAGIDTAVTLADDKPAKEKAMSARQRRFRKVVDASP